MKPFTEFYNLILTSSEIGTLRSPDAARLCQERCNLILNAPWLCCRGFNKTPKENE